MLHEVLEDILIGAGDAEVEVGIQDCADVEDILDGILSAFVYAVFYDAELSERIGRVGEVLFDHIDTLGHLLEFDTDCRIPDPSRHVISSLPM